ncbi:MAG: tRNA lysidine(34) synthetase TilS [Legionellales bacterium]
MTKPLLHSEWITGLNKYHRVWVGFSGGLDSTVLLHLLADHEALRPKLEAVHINHGISPNAPSWQNHCVQVCAGLGLPFSAYSVECNQSSNLEENARTARYAVFSSLLKEQDVLVLAHHQDDQAETVLLQLFRGAGVDGLAAMAELSQLGCATLARPLLTCTRQQLEHYAVLHGLKWIEDESNQDSYYSRNYLRQQVMPLLAKQWPGVVNTIARAADNCQQAKAHLDALAILDCPELSCAGPSLSIEPLNTLNFERQSNVLRVWLKKNQVQAPSAATFKRLIHEVLLSNQDAMPLVSWNAIQVRRYQKQLYLDKTKPIALPSCIDWEEFPNPLMRKKYALHLSVIDAQQGLTIPKAATIQVRFRQGGEEIKWHGQTKQLKKLFQEWAIPPWQRDRLPLIYINNLLAVVVGYAISDDFYSEYSPQTRAIINTQVN